MWVQDFVLCSSYCGQADQWCEFDQQRDNWQDHDQIDDFTS
jgi:hypothetical protein